MFKLRMEILSDFYNFDEAGVIDNDFLYYCLTKLIFCVCEKTHYSFISNMCVNCSAYGTGVQERP